MVVCQASLKVKAEKFFEIHGDITGFLLMIREEICNRRVDDI